MRPTDEEYATACAIMITDAAALNAEVIHRDNDIDAAIAQVTELQESAEKIRQLLERDRAERERFAGGTR